MKARLARASWVKMRLEWVRAADYLSEAAALDEAQGVKQGRNVDQTVNLPHRLPALAVSSHDEMSAANLFKKVVAVSAGQHSYARLRHAVAAAPDLSSSCGEPLSPENIPGSEEAERKSHKSRMLGVLPIVWGLLCTAAAALLLELWNEKHSIIYLVSGQQ